MSGSRDDRVMYEMTGSLWREHAAGSVVAITTNGLVTKKGDVPMLRGCARQARERFPEIPRTLGGLIRQYGSHVFDLGHRIVSFPVEENPYQIPDLRLIEQSCRELVELVDYKQWNRVVVPRPGCGGGGLAWSEVRPVLERHFDQRFYIITQEHEYATGEIR